MKWKDEDEDPLDAEGVYVNGLDLWKREKARGERPDLYEVYQHFLETRRNDGKRYTQQIIKILKKHRKNWVRARDLKQLKFCPEATLFRLLAGLEENKIIEHKIIPNNRNVSSYRLSPDFPNYFFLTDNEMLEDYGRLFEDYELLYENFQYVIKFITAHNLKDEYDLAVKTGKIKGIS